MAQNASNDISYFLLLDDVNKADLGTIRIWNNLKVAFDEKKIWIKDFTPEQIHSVEVKSIPYKTIYYSKETKLYLQNSLLPDRNIPLSLLWTPIDRALPVILPAFNHNYFGIHDKISIELIVSEKEEEACAMITTLETLKHYIETAPAIRLQSIQWTILNKKNVLLVGKPLLPVTGNTYWQQQEMLLPVGFDFELPVLANKIRHKINPEKQVVVLWNSNNTYQLIDKQAFKPLSLGSFRATVNHPLFYSSVYENE
jgi:hypothetical protein